MSVHRKIEKFLRATDMPPTKFGRLAVSDPRFVFDLRLGREPGPKVTARVEAFLAAQKLAAQQSKHPGSDR